MNKLNLPSFNFNIKKSDGQSAIFDIIRKKYIVLTPEEWVRQHFIHYLINQLGFSKPLISVERGLKYNSLQKRSDILVFSRDGSPLILVECKAITIRLNQRVMDQAVMYNRTVAAKYIILTNGMEHSCMKVSHSEGKVDYLNSLPTFAEIGN